MDVEWFGGSAHVTSSDELSAVLSRRNEHGNNELWLFCAQEYPRMSVFVRGDVACVHYFPSEGHPGFVVLGEGQVPDDLCEDGSAVFYVGDGREKVWVTPDFVVPFAAALAAAQDFLRDPESLPELHELFRL